MEAKPLEADAIFRLFTACPNDPRTYILDVRPQKEFARCHVLAAYSARLSADGSALLDYSKASYDQKWSQGAECANKLIHAA